MSLIPPLGFASVSEGIYRSAYPIRNSYPFIETLKIKTFICLNPSEVKQELIDYAERKSIELLKFDININQEPFVSMDEEAMRYTVEAAIDPLRHPVLIFCLNGKVRTSCAVGCIRRAQTWAISSILDEYDRFVEPEGSLVDINFIERYVHNNPS